MARTAIAITTGSRFGQLTVISLNENYNNRPYSKDAQVKSRKYYNCRCDCGGFIIARADNLRAKKTVQCALCGYSWMSGGGHR